MMTPLKKREFWKVIRESKFPILLGSFVTMEGFLELCMAQPQLATVSFLRLAVYVQMT